MDRNLSVKGRGKLTARALVGKGYVVLRLDDDRDDAFWAEVELTADQLRALLRLTQAADGEIGPGEED